MNIIVDYKMGNMRSILYKLQKENIECIITSNRQEIKNAEKLILPGVGHFKQAMKNLQELNLIEVLADQVLKNKIPVFGICLGFQLMAKSSEEGNVRGLGWIDAEVKRFDFTKIDNNLPVPHVGWCDLSIKKESRLLHNIDSNQRFYFTHSYYMHCNNQKDILCTSDYGYQFTAGIERGNISGVQFHPEKSHKSGFQMLLNWVNK